MSVIATASLPAGEFTLGAALTVTPGTRVYLERVVPVSDTFVPYFWAADGAVESIEARLQNEEDIESFRVIDTSDGEALVRVEWSEDVDGFLAALSTSDAMLLRGVGEAETWRFQLRFEDHDHLTSFYRTCADHDIPIELERIHNPGPPREPGVDADLTEAQREALLTALEEGYFAVPRRINLSELAEKLGVSDSAVSQRLRRGLAGLLSTTMAEPDEQ